MIKRISKQAKDDGVDFDLKREGGNHSVFDVGGCMIPIPRHKEIDDNLAREIFRQCEPVFGEDWWK